MSPIIFIFTLILVTLKLMGAISSSWVIVFLALTIYLAAQLILIAVVFIILDGRRNLL